MFGSHASIPAPQSGRRHNEYTPARSWRTPRQYDVKPRQFSAFSRRTEKVDVGKRSHGIVKSAQRGDAEPEKPRRGEIRGGDGRTGARSGKVSTASKGRLEPKGVTERREGHPHLCPAGRAPDRPGSSTKPGIRCSPERKPLTSTAVGSQSTRMVRAARRGVKLHVKARPPHGP